MTDIHADLNRFKANSKLFSLMDEVGLQRLADVAKTEAFRPNSNIIREGELGNTFYVIVQGGVRVLVQGLDEEAKEVARLGAGAFFGEMAVLNNELCTASVTAIGEVQCFAFEKQAVLAILHDYPRVKQVLGLVGLKRAEQLIDTQMKD